MRVNSKAFSMIKQITLISILLLFSPNGLAFPIDEYLKTIQASEEAASGFVSEVEMTLKSDEQIKKQYRLKIAVLNDSAIALFLAPSIDRGKVILQKDNTWFQYFPKANRYIRVSPRKAFFGSLSYGDIVAPPVTRFYDYQTYQLAKTPNQVEIVFQAKSGIQNVAIYKKEVLFDTQRNIILRIRNYSRSNTLLGEVNNTNFESHHGQLFVTASQIANSTKTSEVIFLDTHTIQKNKLNSAFFLPHRLHAVEKFLGN